MRLQKTGKLFREIAQKNEEDFLQQSQYELDN